MQDDLNSAPADLAAVDVEAAAALEDRLPLVATIGFTGHRAIEDIAAAERKVEQVLAIVGAAFDLIIEAPLADAYDGAPRLRLLIGDAPGADRVAAQVWREQGLGEVHAIYPFKDPGGEAAFTDRPDRDDPETRVQPPPEFGPWTGIDSEGLGLPSDRAHAEVGRWIVRHSDVLIGWWNGKPGQGVGGTNDTMERALERGLPVIWLHPDKAAIRLIDPHASRRHADASEAMLGLDELARPLTSEALAELLRPAFTAPGDARPNSRDPEVVARRDYASIDPLRIRPPPAGWVQRLFNRTLWRSFRLFETVAGGAAPAKWNNDPPPEGLALQPGFARLRAASAEAGARANALSSIHRSEQLLLVVIAILAVLTGALPSLLAPALTAPGSKLAATPADAAETSVVIHAIAAAAEFCLGLLAVVIAFTARRAHRHRRWSDARRLAERLRGACATWPLGIDVADVHVEAAQTWTEWRVRAVLRASGPRRGWITKPRFEQTAAWVIAQLIDSQIAYHDRQHRMAERIERTIRHIEGGSFFVLMTTLAAYVGVVLAQPWTGWTPPPTVSGLVTLLSAVSPAIGAGCLALDATNSFGEIALHSARLKAEFERRKAELGLGAGADYHHVQFVVRSAAQLLRDENDAWRDSLLRRRIVRG